jgi:hypothetical protein
MKVILMSLMLLISASQASAHIMLRGLLAKIAEQPSLPISCTLAFDQRTDIVKIKNEKGIAFEFKAANLDEEVQVSSDRNNITWFGGNYSDDADVKKLVYVGLESNNQTPGGQLVALRVSIRAVDSEGPTFFEADCLKPNLNPK